LSSPTQQNELTRNDGIMHGKFLRRSHLPGLDRTNFQEVLRVGCTVELYGRTVMLYACDDATRSFFEALGVEQPDNFEPAMDSYTEATVRGAQQQMGCASTAHADRRRCPGPACRTATAALD
jgi:hypothetical protein